MSRLLHFPTSNSVRRAKSPASRFVEAGLALLSRSIVALVDRGASRKTRDSARIDPKKILVVQLYDTLGDVICASPLYRELAGSFPGAEITVAVSASGIPGIMEQNPHIADVIAVDTRCARWIRPLVLPWRHWRLARRVLRSRSFDVAIVPRSTVDFCYATFLAYFSGARMRIGYTERTSRRKSILNRGFDRLLTHVLAAPAPGTNEVRVVLNVLAALDKWPSRDETEMWLTRADGEFAARALDGAGRRRVCISPTSGHSELKQWGAERFAQLAAALAGKGCTVVLVGSGQDRALAEVMERRCGGACINLTGRTTIRQMAAVASQCQLFVGNDAGPAHAASAVGTATLTIFGSSCHHQFAPWGKANRVVARELACGPCQAGHQIDRCARCIYDTPHCMESITVEEVLSAAVSMLESAAAAGEVGAGELKSEVC